jgi:hypothetical protein
MVITVFTDIEIGITVIIATVNPRYFLVAKGG